MRRYTFELPLTDAQIQALREIAQSHRKSVQALLASAIGALIAPIMAKRTADESAATDNFAREIKNSPRIPDLALRYFDAALLRRLAGLPAAPKARA